MNAVVFASTTAGAVAVARLVESGFEVKLVITASARGLPHGTDPAVEEVCARLGVACRATDDPGQFGWIERIRRLEPGMIFAAGYPFGLKAQVLALPRHGCFRIHYSLLPAFRGPDPVRTAILSGESTTGVTLHEMETTPYAGAVVDAETVDIAEEDTAATLERKLDRASSVMLARTLPSMRQLSFTKRPQRLPAGPTHPALTPEDGRIDWSRSAREIHSLVRAFTRPYTGAFSLLGEDMVFFWKTLPALDAAVPPGRCVTMRGEALVGAGVGCIRPVEIEVNGRVLSGEHLRAFFREHEGASFS